MSVVYYAYAVVGVRLLPKQFVTKDVKRVRGCKHEFDSDFCPVCGSPKWREEKISFDALATDEGDDKLDVFHGIPVCYNTDDQYVYLGITAKTSYYGEEDECEINILSIEQIREKLKSVLEPLGIWDEKSFGLWAVLYCSY